MFSQIDQGEDIIMDCKHVEHCVTRATIQAMSVGLKLVIGVCNEHPIPGVCCENNFIHSSFCRY